MARETLSNDGSWDYMLKRDGSLKDFEPVRQKLTPEKFTPAVLERMRLAFIAEYLKKP